MTPEEWRHIKTVFQRALELSAADRADWLGSQSDAVRQEVDSLLRAYEHDNALPGTSSSDTAAAAQSGQDLIGRRFGPYRVLSQLGEGGMGTVWLAMRDDGLFTRQVALKLVHPALMGRSMSERAAREREILASLKHPNIAQLFDAGFAEDGQPYLTLEYVEGTPLTKYCDDHHLGVGERLALFRQVLGAVQYAHSRRVIHRDLKPSNILVSDDGQAHLLDFGIAKLLMPGAAPEMQLTLTAARALTPDYAAPEQIAGDVTSTAADVYALGVILYELLSGERPYRLHRPSRGALEAAILRTEPVAPSRLPFTQETTRARATSTQKLARDLRGDLDTIIRKALKKSPSERYESAEAFNADIARFLSGAAVLARPDTIAYRARKFAARHRVGVAGASLLVVMLAAGISKYLTSAPAAFAPPPHSIAVLPFVNLSGDEQQEYFSDGISEDLITALSQFPGLKVIGRTSAFQFRDSKEGSRSIGAKLTVAHLLQGSVRRSGAVVRVSAELTDTADGSTEWSERYDRPYKDLFGLQDEITRAVAGALRAKLLPGERAAPQSDRPPGGGLEAYNAFLRGRFYASRATEAGTRKAIEYYARATQLDPRYALAWSRLARAWNSLGSDYLEGAPEREAYAQSRAAIDRALALTPDLAAAHIARGYLLRMADFDWPGAEAEFRRALELTPNDGEAEFSLGYQLASFGEVELAIELTRKALVNEPLQANWYAWLANYLLALDRLDEAERAIREAIELEPEAEWYHRTLAVVQIRRGSVQAALAAARQEASGQYQDSALALALQFGSDPAAADAALKTLIEKDAGIAAYYVAEVYAVRGDAKETFEWLDRAWGNRDVGIPLLLFDPFILRYKGDPRFILFCRKVGLPVQAEVSLQPRS